jgi:hypothetical protein
MQPSEEDDLVRRVRGRRESCGVHPEVVPLFINSKSIGLALQVIQAGMSQRGHVEAGWPESLGQSLQKGLLLYKTVDKPSNFTLL